MTSMLHFVCGLNFKKRVFLAHYYTVPAQDTHEYDFSTVFPKWDCPVSGMNELVVHFQRTWIMFQESILISFSTVITHCIIFTIRMIITSTKLGVHCSLVQDFR